MESLVKQAVRAFVNLKSASDTGKGSPFTLHKELASQVRSVLGPFAAPKKICIVSDLPKTTSGKIM